MTASAAFAGADSSSMPSPEPVDRELLVQLAREFGVATDFTDWRGRTAAVSDSTVRAVLAALGVDTATDDTLRAALETKRLTPWRTPLPPTVVTRVGAPATVRVVVGQYARIELVITLEDGYRRTVPLPAAPTLTRDIDGSRRGAYDVPLPPDLPPGWHRLTLSAGGGGSACTLIVTPERLGLPDSVQEQGAWGFWLQLYAARSRRSWAMGELPDLAELAEWSARELGAGFVLVNPLHSAEPVAPLTPSPYLPMTRRFASPLYLRVEDVPEYAGLPEADRAAVETLAQKCRKRNTTDDLLDRDAVWAAKSDALARMHSVQRDAGREAAYRAFREREGQGLLDFATWCAFVERHGRVWRLWPEHLHDPHSPGVERERDELADRVDFYCWLQWMLDEQLEQTQRRASEAGMPIGVLHDLAVGVNPDSADAWALQDVLAAGVSVGAPPDAFNQQGQDWSQPPWRPDRLAETGYAPYRELVRTLLRHSGGLRIDHILGLFRLWWVPQGAGPGEGTYVRYDVEALIGILALEAARTGAILVGEDLGTVEPGVRPYLAERGVLGTSLLWFEYGDAGGPLPPEHWRELSLATVGTHDLPPTAGYLAGEHVRVRAELGLLTRDYEEERREDEAQRRAWRDLLVQRDLLREDEVAQFGSEEAEVLALHRLLATTPARLLGVALPDAAGDRRIINQPGTNDEYPNWRVPLADAGGAPVLLEDVMASERARRLAAAVQRPEGRR